MKTGPKLPPLTSARGVREAKHSGGNVDVLRKIKDVTGLYLNITTTNTKSWMYRYTFARKRLKMGLGSYPEVSLKAAREIARHNAELVAKSIEPKEERKRLETEALAKQSEGITFMEVAEEWMTGQIESKEWILAQTISSRRSWFNDYVYPIIGNLAILDITFDHAVKVLSQKTRKGQPHLWNDSNSQARKIRGYCEDIIDMGLIKLGKRNPHFNVFTYKNNLSRRFGKPSKIHEAESQPFLHYEHLPNFVEKLIRFQEQAPEGSRPEVDCFIFGMLACTRSNCTRIADWADIDLKEQVWTVPKEKVGKKTKKDWPIPLHPRAIAIIKAQPSAKRKVGRVFSSLKHAKLSDRSLTSLLKLFPDIKAYKEKPGDPDRFPVFHGMRTTMNGWAKANQYDFDTRDLMLQHLQESTTHAAYDRGNAMLEERRAIVNGYEEYAFSMVTSNKVVPLERKASWSND